MNNHQIFLTALLCFSLANCRDRNNPIQDIINEAQEIVSMEQLRLNIDFLEKLSRLTQEEKSIIMEIILDNMQNAQNILPIRNNDDIENFEDVDNDIIIENNNPVQENERLNKPKKYRE